MGILNALKTSIQKHMEKRISMKKRVDRVWEDNFSSFRGGVSTSYLKPLLYHLYALLRITKWYYLSFIPVPHLRFTLLSCSLTCKCYT